MLYEWLTNMDFAFPMAFGLLVFIPFLLFWYIKKNNRQQAPLLVSTTDAFQIKSWKNRFRHLPFILRLLALIALTIALARPQKRNDEQRTEGEGIDIVLCMDVSGSMGTRDILPSRMEAAKEVAAEFVMSRPVDQIGIVVFSGESFTLCPLTTDKDILITQIKNLSLRIAQGAEESGLTPGTAIGEGLTTAVSRLNQSKAKSKVIILLTDGKEDAPATRLIDPLTAMEVAKTKRIKVYTIGMGATGSTAPEIEGNNPSQKNPTIDFIDETLLRRIAEETGGRYFRARDKEGLKNTYEQIDQMEKSKVELHAFKRYEERFLVFVLAALGFLFLEILLRLTVFKKFP